VLLDLHRFHSVCPGRHLEEKLFSLLSVNNAANYAIHAAYRYN